MKFSFLLLLTSNAILATSATYNYEHLRWGQDLGKLYDESARKWKEESFEEAMKNLEKRTTEKIEKDYARPARRLTRLTRLLLGRLGLYRFKCKTIEDLKYETYKERTVEMAKWTENKMGFLVSLKLYITYFNKVAEEANKIGDHNTLGLLRRDKIEIFLSASAASQEKNGGDRFRFEILFAFGELEEHDFPELMDKAAAQGLDWLVEILLDDYRAESGIASLWQNIKSDTTLPDLVGTHLLEYAEKEIGTLADDQKTANEMLFATMEYRGMNILRFLALVDKADKETHEKLWHNMCEVHATQRPLMVAVLLAYGKLDGGKLDGGYYFQKIDSHLETEVAPKLKALLLELTQSKVKVE